MAPEGVPGCCSMGYEWKASTYDKKNFEGTWVTEKESGRACCGKVCVSSHCLCYTCTCYYCCGIPMFPDLTWTCGDNCWISQGGSQWILGDNDVAYHSWLGCPSEKMIKMTPQGGTASQEMER